jgi:hypothetical protein
LSLYSFWTVTGNARQISVKKARLEVWCSRRSSRKTRKRVHSSSAIKELQLARHPLTCPSQARHADISKDSLDRAYRHPYVVNSPEPELRALGALIELAARLQQQARTSALSGSRPHHQHPGPHATGENAQSREARLVGERAKLVRRIGAPH